MSKETVPGNTLNNAPVRSGEKTSILEKISLFLINTSVMPGTALVSGALIFFYTEVAGIDPAKLTLLLVVARIFDGFNDPLQAYMIDHLPRTKMGRFRPYLMIGSFICSLNLILVFFGPYWASGAWKMVIVWITYIMLDMTGCFMGIPNDCLLPVMTDDPKDRNLLAMIKGVAVTFGSVIVGLPLPFLLEATPNDRLQAFAIIIVGGAILTTGGVSLGALGIKERIPAEEDQKYSWRELLQIFIQRPVYALFLAYMMINVSVATTSTGGLYFFTYVMKDVKFMVTAGMVGILGGMPGVFTAPMFANRFGKRTSFTMGAAIMFAANAIRLLNVRSKPLMLLASAFNTFGSSMAHPLAFGIMADNTDYIEYKTDKRAEGAVSALNSLVNKFSQGIGGGLATTILSRSGYVPPPDGWDTEINGIFEQTERAQNGMILMVVVAPIIANLAAAILFRTLYPLNKKDMEEITLELHERRAARGEIEEEIAEGND